jgi:hypothetical protein
MMMKGNGGIEDKKKKITSSSSSSSLLIDEQKKLKSYRYNFAPTRLIAKSTEQLNRSFASDSLVNHPPPLTSILKQTSTSSAINPSSSKTICMPTISISISSSSIA